MEGFNYRRGRPSFFRQVAPLLVALALVGAISIYLRHASTKLKPTNMTAVVIKTLPSAPDLAGWPRELVERLARDYDAVTDETTMLSALQDMASLYHANGFVAQAQSCYLGLQAIDPSNPRWPYLLALTREDFGDPSQFAEDLRRSLLLDPSYDLILLKLAQAELRMGKADAAKQAFERCLKARPEDPWALVGLARIAIAASDDVEARALLERALQAKDAFGDALALLPDVCIEQGDIAAAKRYRVESDTRGRDSKPFDPRKEALADDCYDVAKLRAWAARRVAGGRLDEAWALLARARTVESADADTLEAMGRLYLESPKRRADWQAGFPTLDAAAAFRRDGEPDQAARLVDIALKRDASQTELWVEKGRDLQALDNLDAAEAAFRRALALAPETLDAQFGLGLLLMESRPKEGVSVLKRYLERAPNDTATRLAVGLYYLSSGAVEVGLATLEEAWKLDPDYPNLREDLLDAYRRRGAALEASGDEAAARSVYERLLSVDPADPGARVGLERSRH